MGIQFSGLASGIDTDSIIKQLMSVERIKVEKVEKEKTLVEWKKEAWEEMNSEIYSFYKEELFDFKSSSTYLKKEVSSSDSTIVDVTATTTSITGSHSIVVDKMAKGSFLTGSTISGVTTSTTAEDLIAFGAETEATFEISDGTTTELITVNKTDTIGQIASQINDLDLDVNFSFDENFERIFISTKDTGTGKQITLNDAGDTLGDDLLTALGFAGGSRTGTTGQDAEFTYNGTALTSSTNDVTVNGLSLSIRGQGTVNISVNHDIDGIYDSIKSFINKYNELQLKITEKIDADYNSDYEPLTDDEKESMSDDDIELWENKIKQSLLRRDDILTNLSYSMRSTLTASDGLDTSEFDYNYLSDLGIITGNYTENGILHIQGDEDDPVYAVDDNTLKEAIESNPEGVAEFFSSLGTHLYDKLTDKMKSTTLSSALTFYNDKYLDKQVEDYEDEIYKLEDRLADVEDRYYAQFTAMEQAMQQSNNTANWLTQQLGGM